MAREDIVVGLDIGTSKTACIIGDIGKGSLEEIEIIGVGVAPSDGLRKGIVINIERTTSSIRKAIEEAELMAGVEIGSAYIGIAGGHVMGHNVNGVVAVSGKDHVVTPEDVNRVINAAKTVAIPPEREVLHILPQMFTVDDMTGIRNPVGITGVRLEVSVHIVTGAVSSAQNLVRCVHLAGLSVEDIVLEPLASAEAVLTPDEFEAGTALIDIGSGTTDLVIYRNGALMHTASLAVGGWNITNDLATVLHLTLPEAETIKREHGCALVELVDPAETISVQGRGTQRTRMIHRTHVAEIVQPRMMEIFELVRQEIEKSHQMINGLVLTGGTALLEGIEELGAAMFEMPVRVGYPRPLRGLSDRVHSPVHATGVGLLLYGTRDRWSGKGTSRFIKGNVFENILQRMRSWFASVREDFF
ncbi:MAG: cell division protein FtsA [Candidatus Poribacteria bacterium]|nr:MAG: cell division protein FtsA [Candidatus Poribacteria bacterium]